MNSAYDTFKRCIADINQLGCIYEKLKIDYPALNEEINDILRAQLIYVVSAMDRFIHEIVRIGIIEIYQGRRTQTSKWKATKLSFKNVIKLIDYERNAVLNDVTLTPIEEIELISILDEEFKPVLKTLSFQQMCKIKDALSYIWENDYKLQSIAEHMMTVSGSTINEKQQKIEQKLQLIIDRRNIIAHEADWDVANNRKYAISVNDVSDSILFIEDFVNAIYLNVSII